MKELAAALLPSLDMKQMLSRRSVHFRIEPKEGGAFPSRLGQEDSTPAPQGCSPIQK